MFGVVCYVFDIDGTANTRTPFQTRSCEVPDRKHAELYSLLYTCDILQSRKSDPPRLHSDETSQVTSLGQATIPSLIAENPSSGNAI